MDRHNRLPLGSRILACYADCDWLGVMGFYLVDEARVATLPSICRKFSVDNGTEPPV